MPCFLKRRHPPASLLLFAKPEGLVTTTGHSGLSRTPAETGQNVCGFGQPTVPLSTLITCKHTKDAVTLHCGGLGGDPDGEPAAPCWVRLLGPGALPRLLWG